MTTRADSSQRRRQTQDKTATNMATSSQRMAVTANKNKNWRANYLRALNIFTPDLATSTRGRHAPSGDSRRRPAAQPMTNGHGRSETTSRRRTTTATATVPAVADDAARRPTSNNSSRERSSVSASVSTSAKQSSSRSGSSSRSRRTASPSDEKSSTYVFGLRSHLFRARRVASRNEVTVVDHVSAPVEIPTSTSVTSPTPIPSRTDKLSGRRDSESRRQRGSSNDFQNSTDPKQPMVQLLSWEEPSVMLGNGGWPLESEKRSSNNDGFAVPVSRNDSRRTRKSSPLYAGGIAEECEDTEDEGLTNTEDDDDDIFKMEFDGEGSDSNANRNVFRDKRASKKQQRPELRQRRPGGFDDFDDDEDDGVVTPLSASFVPPHQMVERGCFSLGLRDELKRKPGVPF